MLVVKVGGGAAIKWDEIARDPRIHAGDCLLFHGANALMRDVCARLGIEERVLISPSGQVSRYTDSDTLGALIMVYAGLANKQIVACLQSHGLRAVGLSGADGCLLLGARKEAILAQEKERIKLIRDSATGKVEKTNISLLRLLLESGYLPVLTIPAITQRGELINVDGDRAVAILARDLKAEAIVMLLEAPGLLENASDSSSLVRELSASELESFMLKVEGRMRKKLLGIAEALRFGIKRIYLGDGRRAEPITSALEGEGTVINA